MKVPWKLAGETRVTACTVPSGVSVSFASNDALTGKKVVFNDRKLGFGSR